MNDERERARIERVAIGVASALLLLTVIDFAYAASYFSRFRSGSREAIPEAVQDVAWLPLMAAAWWVKIRAYSEACGH